MSFSSIEKEFEQRLSQCWQSVLVADVVQLDRSTGWLTISRDVRAAAMVFAMAEFEGLLKDATEHLHALVEAAGVPVGDLKPGLRVLHLMGDVTRAQGAEEGQKTWPARMRLADSNNLKVPPDLPRRDSRGFLHPIGNATPNPSTVARLWTVYEFSGQPLPNLSWRQALSDGSEIRNDVAHRRGQLKSVMSGSDRTSDVIARQVRALQDLGLHVIDAMSAYCASAAFVR